MTAVVAATWVWVGMVLAISFVEAPLKFRAPGITTPLGLGIGRLVFRALNIAELVLLAVVVIGLVVVRAGGTAPVLAAVVGGVLAAQLVVVRPVLTRRTDAVLRGDAPSGSRAHLGYVALEVAKLGLLVALGITAVA